MLTGKSLLAILASILRIFEDQSLTLAVRLSRTRNCDVLRHQILILSYFLTACQEVFSARQTALC
jgi:hypothetical protein